MKTTLSKPIDKLLLFGIAGYQKYLSPHKGYRCAYSVLHGGTGCSGYVKNVVKTEGFFSGYSKIIQRFEDCRGASHHLQTLDCNGCDAVGCDSGFELPGCGSADPPSQNKPSGSSPIDACFPVFCSSAGPEKNRKKKKSS